MQSFSEMLSHVGSGRLVKVTISDDDNDRIEIVGYLEALTNDGEAEIIVNGVKRYCWPVLKVEEVDEERRYPFSNTRMPLWR